MRVLWADGERRGDIRGEVAPSAFTNYQVGFQKTAMDALWGSHYAWVERCGCAKHLSLLGEAPKVIEPLRKNSDGMLERWGNS